MSADVARRRNRRARVAARSVTEVMSRPVFGVTTSATLAEALDLLVEAGVRHLVVVGDGDRCAGILADRTVAAVWARDPTALVRIPVGVVLDAIPSIVEAGATVAEAARVMGDAGLDAVAVVSEDGRPIGIVTSADLVALLAT
jgi:CBS domain-containing protein